MSTFYNVLSRNFVSGTLVKTGFSSFTEEKNARFIFFPLLSFPILLLNTLLKEKKKKIKQKTFFPLEIKKMVPGLLTS